MIRIAILGYGTVGVGVAELIDEGRERIAAAVGDVVEVGHIFVRRDHPGSPHEMLMTRDIGRILDDPDVAVVCEAMGGIDPALSYVRGALERGKHVCTSNKELIDAHGPELCALSKAHACSCLFEASVAGGVPILRTLRTYIAQERVSQVVGILNGTCNYILTRMAREGLSFDAALRGAQEQGFAEQDPTADVEGHDAARKLAILASMISGRRVAYEQIPCRGIRDVEDADLLYARALGASVKLLGTCEHDAGHVEVSVGPCLVMPGHPLVGVDSSFNGVMTHMSGVGDLTFVGRGAGRRPTASAVLSDVIECLRAKGHVGAGLTGVPAASVGGPSRPMRRFLRASSDDAARAMSALGEDATSVRVEGVGDEMGIIAPPMTERELDDRLRGIPGLRARMTVVES